MYKHKNKETQCATLSQDARF